MYLNPIWKLSFIALYIQCFVAVLLALPIPNVQKAAVQLVSHKLVPVVLLPFGCFMLVMFLCVANCYNQVFPDFMCDSMNSETKCNMFRNQRNMYLTMFNSILAFVFIQIPSLTSGAFSPAREKTA